MEGVTYNPLAPADGQSTVRVLRPRQKSFTTLEELAGAPWAPDPPPGRGVSSDVARLE